MGIPNKVLNSRGDVLGLEEDLIMTYGDTEIIKIDNFKGKLSAEKQAVHAFS